MSKRLKALRKEVRKIMHITDEKMRRMLEDIYSLDTEEKDPLINEINLYKKKIERFIIGEEPCTDSRPKKVESPLERIYHTDNEMWTLDMHGVSFCYIVMDHLRQEWVVDSHSFYTGYKRSHIQDHLTAINKEQKEGESEYTKLSRSM